MEDPHKHEKKKKNKTMPVAIKFGVGAGAGSFGIGGIVLLGGALVTATIISALAIKTRRQRRSTSDTVKNSRSPSPEPKSIGAPNELDLTMKINKDRESSKYFSVESTPVDLQNPSSDRITKTTEMQANLIQNLILDEKQNFGIGDDEKMESGDGNKEVFFSAVGEDEEINKRYERSPVVVVVAAGTEVGFHSSEEESDTGILVMSAPKDDGNNVSTEKALVCSEAIMEAVEEEEGIEFEKARDIAVVEAALGDDVAEEIPTGHADEDNRTVFMNEEEVEIEVEEKPQVQFVDDEMIVDKCKEDLINETRGFADEQVMGEEAACVHEIEVVQVVEEEKEKEIIVENCERDLSKETASADEIVREEEAIEVACDEVQEMHVSEAFSGGEHSSTAVAYMNQVREDNPPSQFMNQQEEGTAQQVQVEMISEDEIPHVQLIKESKDDPPSQLMNKEEEKEEEEVKEIAEKIQVEMITEDEIPHVQLVEEAKDDDQTVVREHNPPRQFMNKEEEEEEEEEETAERIEVEMITKDEIAHVQLIEEARDDDETAGNPKEETAEEVQVEMITEGEIPHVQLVEEAKDDDQTVVRKHNPPRQFMNKEEEEEEETAERIEVEMITKDEIAHVQLIEEARDDDETAGNPKEETAEEVQVEMITENELVNKEDEIPHGQSIEEEEEDATMEGEEGSDGTGDSSNGVAIWPMQEELTPETNISTHKIQQEIQGKVENDSDHNQIMNQDNPSSKNRDRKQAPANQPWKLKLQTWSVLVSIWCLCHWYSELPFPQISLVASFFFIFILILLGFQKRTRTRYLAKYD